MKPPIVEKHEGIFVVRDDYIAGGTKRRYLHHLFEKHNHIVYASPAYGGAQLALAYAARDTGKQASIFTAERKQPHARTLEAKEAGAQVFMVKGGYLKVVQSKAKAYADYAGAYYLPFGGDTKENLQAIADTAQLIADEYGEFDEVWCASGSGVLTRGLQKGLKAKKFISVQVGKPLTRKDVGIARIERHPYPFEKELNLTMPFDSCPNYDRKAWQLCKEKGKGRVLFWNVMGKSPTQHILNERR